MDSASTEADGPGPGVDAPSTAAAGSARSAAEIPEPLLGELWERAEGALCGLSRDELAAVLAMVGTRLNHGLPAAEMPTAGQRGAFLRSLHLSDLALAHACALGREVAWRRFLARYRASLVQAAAGVTGSASLGEELADALYAEPPRAARSRGRARRPAHLAVVFCAAPRRRTIHRAFIRGLPPSSKIRVEVNLTCAGCRSRSASGSLLPAWMRDPFPGRTETCP